MEVVALWEGKNVNLLKEDNKMVLDYPQLVKSQFRS